MAIVEPKSPFPQGEQRKIKERKPEFEIQKSPIRHESGHPGFLGSKKKKKDGSK